MGERSTEETEIKIGQSVFDSDGYELGTVRGISESGFIVARGDDLGGLSITHDRAGPNYGEAELVWRCLQCGEVGDIDTFPEHCPGCNAPREHVYYWIED